MKETEVLRAITHTYTEVPYMKDAATTGDLLVS